MNAENIRIHNFEYRGYKVSIIEGAGYKKGDPYCWECEEEGVTSFDASGENPTDFDEMVSFIKKELDKEPECIRIKPYHRNKSPKVDITQDIETKRRFIINDFEKHGFKDCKGVKWVINFPQTDKIKGYSSLRYYPRIIQHNGFEIWFEIVVEYKPQDKENTLNILKETFEKLECKPVFNDGNMRYQSFDLTHNSYFSEEYDIQIRESHPRHGSKYVRFYINPDYDNVNVIQEGNGIEIFFEPIN